MIEIGASSCAVVACRLALLDELVGVGGKERFGMYLAPVGKLVAVPERGVLMQRSGCKEGRFSCKRLGGLFLKREFLRAAGAVVYFTRF